MKAYHIVKIVKGTDDSWCWYKGRIGQRFEVTKAKLFDSTFVYQVVTGKCGHSIIRVEDTELIEDIMVNDIKICRMCGYNKDTLITKICSHCGCEF